MNNPRGVKPYKVIKDFLFSAVNKEFFVFLFFLAVSAGFWFMTVLNETTEKEIPVPVQLVGIPNNIVICVDVLASWRHYKAVKDQFHFLCAWQWQGWHRYI